MRVAMDTAISDTPKIVMGVTDIPAPMIVTNTPKKNPSVPSAFSSFQTLLVACTVCVPGVMGAAIATAAAA